MKDNYLNPYPTIKASCEWLQKETGKPWTLPLLLKHGLRPWFWLDNQDGLSEPAKSAIFNGRTEGYFAEMCFAGDIARLTTDTSDVVVTITRTADGKHMKMRYPGLRFSLDCLRFLHADIAQLANKFSKSADVPAAKEKPASVKTPAQITQNKLRRNNLDPAIDKAIKQAKNTRLADVYLELKELALTGEKPFTGALEGDALCYTDDNNKPEKFTKEALGKRLTRRANKAATN